MRTVEEIRDLKAYCEGELYGRTRTEQREDLTYINDTFVIDIKHPHREFHSGIGREIVDAAAQQINTSNPQALVKILSGSQDPGKRLSAELNERWIPTLLRQSPSHIKEYVKGCVSRGEAYYKIVHNERWADCPECNGKGKIGRRKCKNCKGEGILDIKDRVGLPIRLITPEPMVVYASPQEDDHGRPDWVLVLYERQLKDLIPLYPYLDKIKDKKHITWLEYIDKDIKYCEADGITVTDGIQPNIYPFVNYVRKYSGFGRRDPFGELSELIVSDVRLARDMIMEEAMLRSDIASILHIFAHQTITIIVKGATLEVTPEQLRKNLKMGAYDVNILDNLPEGTDINWGQRDLPSAEMFQRLHDLHGEILRKYPLIAAALPLAASGRSKDITSTLARRRYDTVIENTQNAFATILEMGLEICNTIPDWKPAGLNKDDLKANYRIAIDLKAPDPIEEDRLSAQGEKLWSNGNGSIDLKTNLMNYQGRTEEEADEIMARRIIDRLTNSEEVGMIYKLMFAEEAGLRAQLEGLQEAGAQVTGEGGASFAERRAVQGEVKTQRGREETELSLENKGTRTPPRGV
ncbi:hypothetical protein LCGC14_0880490 [marine sediment metagenome]|uniref:Portal protein n=1 Tax=marine sediment metagenome TaxID=412755 RepID=A0A0F9PMQ4_9ZZZZ